MNPNGDIASCILDAGAVTFSLSPPFVFSSGISAPVYCDNRLLFSHVLSRKLIVEAFCESITSSTQQIAGVATAGIPWAAMVAHQLDLPLVYVRSQAKAHGQKKLIEGKALLGETVLIEDLISTGQSSLKALGALRDEDVFVTGIHAIFSYAFDQTHQAFKESEVKAKPLLAFDDMLACAKERHMLDAPQIHSILQWQKSPQTWSPPQNPSE